VSIFVTGAAGFIGAHVARALLARGEEVIGVDNLNDYYTPALKRARLDWIGGQKGFSFHEIDIAEHDALREALEREKITSIIHLAAQAGVRYSLIDPFAYTHSNVSGHLSILELARRLSVSHLVYASSSSVYGANKDIPFKEEHRCDHPVSLYGATKRASELMSHSYARLYQTPLTGLRFFTVYGPWGRPDMAYWIFAEKIMKGAPIEVFNRGKMSRDFTYIDDIVDGVIAAHDAPPGEAQEFHRIYNLGNDRPEKLTSLIERLEKALGARAEKELLGMQAGDVERTWADISRARADLGFAPTVSLAEGLSRFVAWTREHPEAFP